MSSSYSIFINKDISLERIKSELEGLINIALHKDGELEWTVYRAIFMGLEISLLEAVDFDDSENNDEVKLSQYNYYINVDYLPNAFDEEYIDDWRKLTSIIIGSMLARKLECKVMVIKNMQLLIESFLPNAL